MIVTYTGKYFDYSNITKDSINIADVIPAITRFNRFMGHTKRAYGVGEHTLRCHTIAKHFGYSIREQLLVLVHDFTEAYCGDVNTDLKNRLPEYKRIEREIELAIYDYLEIEPPTKDEEFKIRSVDLTMLIIEMRDLTHHDYNRKIEEIKEYVMMGAVNNPLFAIPVQESPALDEGNIMDSLFGEFARLINEYKKGE